MRRYDQGAFVERERVRRPIRDQHRDRFFAELGVARLKDPFALDPDPKGQVTTVNGLIAQTLQRHGSENSALEALQSEIGKLALGVPLAEVGAERRGRPAVNAMSQGRMFDSTFHRWFGSRAFDLPKDVSGRQS